MRPRHLSSPVALATATCVLGVGLSLVGVARELAAVRGLQSSASDLAAETLAECAAFELLGHGAAARPAAGGERTGRFTVVARVHGEPPRQIAVVVEEGTRAQWSFVTDVVPGAAPPALGIRGDLRGGDELPPLLPRARAAQDERTHESWLGRDAQLALLRLPRGTERRDFVLPPARRDHARIERHQDGLVVVDGHLWVDRGDRPLAVELNGSVTIVVRGNVYLGRSLLTTGAGRLTIYAAKVEPEPAEGSGQILLGLPGEAVPEVRTDASLLAEGDVHVHGRTAVLRGSCLVGGEWRGNASGGAVQFTGDRLPVVARELVPGFCVSGPSRPGWLRRRR
jgi:hypothetical protein